MLKHKWGIRDISIEFTDLIGGSEGVDWWYAGVSLSKSLIMLELALVTASIMSATKDIEQESKQDSALWQCPPQYNSSLTGSGVLCCLPSVSLFPLPTPLIVSACRIACCSCISASVAIPHTHC